MDLQDTSQIITPSILAGTGMSLGQQVWNSDKTSKYIFRKDWKFISVLFLIDGRNSYNF